MLRNTILALAAAVALGGVFVATDAMARGGHGGFGRLQNDPEVATSPIRYGEGCWAWGHVLTPRGWVWARVNVCYLPYD